MRKAILILFFVSIIAINVASVQAEDGWSSYESLGTQQNIEIYSSYKPTAQYGDYGFKLKFVNNNSYMVDVSYEVAYTCEKSSYGTSSSKTGGLIKWFGSGSYQEKLIGNAACGSRRNIETLDKVRIISIRKSSYCVLFVKGICLMAEPFLNY
jgi:hypothetical protein